jgi:hypothetical protein
MGIELAFTRKRLLDLDLNLMIHSHGYGGVSAAVCGKADGSWNAEG